MSNDPICSGCRFDEHVGSSECDACVRSRLAGTGSLFMGKYSPEPAAGAKAVARFAFCNACAHLGTTGCNNCEPHNFTPNAEFKALGLLPSAARGAKNDAGKPRAGLMVEDFANALLAVAKVSTFGAIEYAPRSWNTVPNARERYYDAFHRHILAAAAGEVNDQKSGLPHAAHIAWNALALLELQLTEAKKQ